MFKIMRRKKGWIRIVEAFSTILIITGILLIALNRGPAPDETAQRIYDREYFILREIQLDDSLRTNILDAGIGVEGDNLPAAVLSKINERTPANLECAGKICETSEECILDSEITTFPSNKDLYVKAAFISADLNSYSPRQLRLFCWEK